MLTPSKVKPNCAGTHGGGTRLYTSSTGAHGAPPPSASLGLSVPTCVEGGHESVKPERNCWRVHCGTALVLPTMPGGNSTARSRTAPPADLPSASLRSKLNVASKGWDPACVSVVPSALLNQVSQPEKPKPGVADPIVMGLETAAEPRAPPPVAVTRLTTIPAALAATFT